MDLAKIRKKSLQSRDDTREDSFIIPSIASLDLKSTAIVRNVADSDFLQHEAPILAVASIVPAAQYFASKLSERESPIYTPLEAILAGRRAAGCDVESSRTEDFSNDVISKSPLEFLCFRVANEVYGINIMDIKELIKPREVTEVPHTPAFVSGILSLRGTIIAVIDMRVRLGLAREVPTGKERIIVIKQSNSFTGLLVDEVIQVVQVPFETVEAAPTVLDGIDRDFISGIGRAEGRLIIILNLENIADINLF